MKEKAKRAALIIMAAVLLTGMFSFSGMENARAKSANLTITPFFEGVASPGSRNVQFIYEVTNNGSETFRFNQASLVFGDDRGITGIQEVQPIRMIEAGETVHMTFQLSLSDRASTGMRSFQIAFGVAGSADPIMFGPFWMLIVDEGMEIQPPSTPGSRTYRPAADFTHTLGGATAFNHGGGNVITFQVHNRGDTLIRNAEFTITLPDGMSVVNASTSAFVGNISIGQRVGRSFSVTVYDDLEGGRAYPITITVTGSDRGDNPVSLERTFYIPVSGTGAGAVRDIVIENINLPTEAAIDEDFTLAFSVRNTGQSAIRNIKAYAELPENLLNKSNATFVLDSLGAGETQTFSIIMSARTGSNRSIPIKIVVEPLSGAAGSEVIRYASIFAGGGSGAAMTPQLMVDRYSYGGSSVMAGSEFFLDLGLFNTSTSALSNIRVTIISDDGTFVPVDSSNSFFVDRIGAGGRYSRTLRLAVIPAAEQKTTSLTVKMTYEDGESTFTADDTISIPVMQVMRLSVDEIIPPYEVYVGAPGYSSLQFYNLGKTTLNNLMINAEGNFDVFESNSYFVGNMEGGSSDTYSFVFVPREPGPMEGKVIFTYENLDGDTIIHEVPFVFEAMEMPVWDDFGREFEHQRRTPWALIIFGLIIVAVGAGVFFFIRYRKKKQAKMLEIQELMDEQL